MSNIIQELSKLAEVQVTAKNPPHQWLKSAQQLRKIGQKCKQDGDLDQCYVNFLKCARYCRLGKFQEVVNFDVSFVYIVLLLDLKIILNCPAWTLLTRRNTGKCEPGSKRL